MNEQTPLMDESKTPTVSAPKGLVVKLCQVMAEAGYVQKRGTNEKFNYKYATEADVVELLRTKLAARNVFVFPSIVSVERKEHSKTSSGSTMFITDVMIRWTFVDGDTGETYECMMPGCGTDTGDKGLYKSVTGSSKYLFLKAFMLPTGDDPEDEKIDKEEAKQAARGVATRKLKENAAGDESIILTPWKEGRIALSGKGVAIIRAALSEIEKCDLGIMLEPRENVIHMPAAKGFDLVDACKKHNVPTIWMDSQTQHGTNGGAAKPSQAASPVKIIQATARKNGKRKGKNGELIDWALLEVVWDGEKHVCWDSKLWEHIEKSKGAPAVFLTTPSFDGKKSPTIEDISSIGSVTFTNGMPDLQQAER